MFNRIILPADGSDAAWRAIEFADRFARQCGAKLELLHVVGDPADSVRIKRQLDTSSRRNGSSRSHRPSRCSRASTPSPKRSPRMSTRSMEPPS